MKGYYTSIVLGALLFSITVKAHETVPMLQYAMKGLAKDVELVAAPTKKPTPADVTDGMILMGITRARTAAYQLQLIIERAGKYQDGKLIKSEMTPGIGEEPADKQKQLMEVYPVYLLKVKEKLVQAEMELQRQFAEKDPEKRDFNPLKQILGQEEAIIAEAHKLFRPQ